MLIKGGHSGILAAKPGFCAKVLAELSGSWDVHVLSDALTDLQFSQGLDIDKFLWLRGMDTMVAQTVGG